MIGRRGDRSNIQDGGGEAAPPQKPASLAVTCTITFVILAALGILVLWYTRS
jgi:hypothetical protein